MKVKPVIDCRDMKRGLTGARSQVRIHFVLRQEAGCKMKDENMKDERLVLPCLKYVSNSVDTFWGGTSEKKHPV